MATQPAPRLQLITGAGSSPEPRPFSLSHETSYQLLFRKKWFRKRLLPYTFTAASDESAIDIGFSYFGIYRYRTFFRFWLAGGEKIVRLMDGGQIYPSKRK